MLSFLLTVILSEPNQKQGEEKLNSNRNEKRKKLTTGIISLITPRPPHVIFVNFFVDHHSLFSCDVLFEWPLTCFYYYITLCTSNLDFPYVTNMFFWCLKIFLSIIFIFSFDKIMQCKNAASPKLDYTLLFSSKFPKFLEYFKMAAFELKCWAKSNCLVSYNIKIRILLLVQNQRSLRLNCWIK